MFYSYSKDKVSIVMWGRVFFLYFVYVCVYVWRGKEGVGCRENGVFLLRRGEGVWEIGIWGARRGREGYSRGRGEDGFFFGERGL